ncbi:hypothetical protein [Vibrio parahaemolyticus]|uniref:hypothetical protein n=1 Tax=Vibrio parahaemolyticus TaxID=670 RepID=UPI0004DFB3A8|nr:hypothetical protein [Vibrio parahaemolyticus]
MSAPTLHPESLTAINKLRLAIERYLDITTIVEPNNAMAAIEVRMMLLGQQKFTPLPMTRPTSYVAYEWQLPVTISVRTTGGNAGNALAGQAAWINMQLSNYLENELVEVKNVTQTLKAPKGMRQRGAANTLSIVGDAEMVDPQFKGSGFVGNKEQDDHETYDGPFTYIENWQVTMVLTVHRGYHNPLLSEVTVDAYVYDHFDGQILASSEADDE